MSLLLDDLGKLVNEYIPSFALPSQSCFVHGWEWNFFTTRRKQKEKELAVVTCFKTYELLGLRSEKGGRRDFPNNPTVHQQLRFELLPVKDPSAPSG